MGTYSIISHYSFVNSVQCLNVNMKSHFCLNQCQTCGRETQEMDVFFTAETTIKSFGGHEHNRASLTQGKQRLTILQLSVSEKTCMFHNE